MIFVSHKSVPDHELALFFKKILDSFGIDTWIAPEAIPAGTCYAEKIPHALHKCEKVLLILTKDAMLSKHIIKEIDLAQRYNKEVIPVQFGDFALTAEFEYMLCNVQIRKWNDTTKDEIICALMSSARVYEIELQSEPKQQMTLMRGNFHDNIDYAIRNKLLNLDTTVFAVGIDRTGDLSISSTKGILRDLCKFFAEKFDYDLNQMQQLVDRAKAEQLKHVNADQNMDFGDCILVNFPIERCEEYDIESSCFRLLLVANSEKNASFLRTRDLDDVRGIDSREIILRVFNYCNQLEGQANTLFIGAMGTNGLSFPYEVITAEIMNAFLYSTKLRKSPDNLVFSVRNEDMQNAGVTTQSIYNYVRNVASFF